MHLHYLHYLDSVDILGACDNTGEMDDVWLKKSAKLVVPGYHNTL